MLEEIRLSFIKYLDTYFFQRDLQSTLDMFSPNIAGYAPARHQTLCAGF
jgi:hypothetical protein